MRAVLGRLPVLFARTTPSQRRWFAVAMALIVGAVVLSQAMTAQPLIKKTISIDGDFADWDSVLTDPQNILFDGAGTGDLDTPSQAYRNIARSAYTYDDTNVYFLVRAAASWQSNQHLIIYIDKNNSNTLENNVDVVLDHTLNGGGKAWMATGDLFPYKTGDQTLFTPDPITGDGVTELGSEGSPAVTGTVNPKGQDTTDDLTKSMWGATGARWPSGTYSYYECRIKWAALGVPKGSPLNFHFAVTGGSNPPAGVVDNTSPGTVAYTSLAVTSPVQVSVPMSSVATITHTIVQSANITDTVRLSPSTDSSWTVLIKNGSGVATNTVTLRGNETTTVTMYVTVPAGASAGVGENVYLTATSSWRPATTATVRDQVYPGAFVVFPDRASACATNTTIDYRHYIANNTTQTLTFDLRAASASGWTTPPVILDENGVSQLTTVQVLPSRAATITVRVSVPPTATAGTRDTTDVWATPREISGSDAAHDVTTVRGLLDLTPDYNLSVNAGSIISFRHQLTNNWSTAATITLDPRSSVTSWPLEAYDPSGATTMPPVYRLAAHETTEVLLRVVVPNDATGRSLTATVTATSTVNPAVRVIALDKLTVVSVATFSDPSLLVPCTVFRLGQRVFIGESGDAGTTGLEYFSSADSSGTQVFPAPGALANAFIIDGLASASFLTTEGSKVGTWTATAYSNSTTNTAIGSRQFLVTYDASVDRVHADDAVVGSQTIPVSARLVNRNGVAIANSTVGYTVWYDANRNGSLDASDTYIDPATFTPQPYTAGALTRTSAVASVPATGTLTDRWSLSNANFPLPGTYYVTAVWKTAGGFAIDTQTSSFYSPGPWPHASLRKVLRGSSTVPTGTPVTFDIVVTNDGETTLTTVPLRDTSAAGLVFTGASRTPDASSAGGAYWGNVLSAPLAPGLSTTVSVDFNTGAAGGVKLNTAEATGVVDYLGVPLDASPATASVTVSNSSFTLTKVPHAGQDMHVQAGQPVSFDIVVRNTGGAALTSVPLADAFDSARLAWVGAAPSADTTGAGSTSWANVGPLAPGDAATVTVTYVAKAVAGSAGDTATCTPTDTGGIVLDTKTAASAVTITRPAASLAAVASGSYILSGQPVTFTVTVTNSGDTTLASLVTTAAFDPALLGAPNVSDSGIVGAGTITWSTGALAPGNVKVLTARFTAASTGAATVAFGEDATDEHLDRATSATSASVTLALPMSGTMVLNGGAAYTSTTTVSVDSAILYATMMSIDGSWQPYAATLMTVIRSGDGTKSVAMDYKDAGGNTIARTDDIVLDTTPPSTTSNVSGTWSATPVLVALTATDAGSGVFHTYYRVGAGSVTTYTAPFSIAAEGATTITYWSVDNLGNAEGQHAAQVLIDTTAPDVTVTGVTEGLVTSSTVHPGASSTDASAVLSGKLDGVPFALGSAVATEGTHTFVAFATDPVGHVASATVHFTIDRTAPDLAVGGVTEGAYYNHSVAATATSSDPSATITATLNGVAYTPGAPIAAADSYTLVVTATDPAGNATSRTLHFTLDFTAPDVTVTGVTEGLLTSATVHPNASSTDASAVLSGELDGVPFALGSAVATVGAHTFVAFATDPAGNVASATVHFTIDRTAPDVTVTDVTEGLVTSQTVHPSASSTDASAVLSGELDGAAFTLGSVVATEGAHTFVAFATDPAGNVASATVHFTIDRTAPDLAVGGVAGGGLYNHSVAATATSSDLSATITAMLDGQPYVLGSTIATEGARTLVVLAVDAAGNLTSETIHFTLDLTAPDVTVTGVTEGLVTSATVHPDASSADASAVLSGKLDGVPFTLGSAVATEGAHAFVAFATDPAGNVASATVHFTIDRAAPDLTVYGVVDAGSYSTTITVSADSTDASAVITALLDGVPFALGSEIGSGSHTLVVIAADPVGNATTRTIHFTIDTTGPDTAPPDLAVTGVFDGELTSQTVVPDATSTDPTAILSATLNGDDFALGSAVATDGAYVLVAVARDGAGNATTETVHFTIDRTAPDLSVGGVAEGAYHNHSVAATATSSDPSATITATLNGAAYTPGAPITVADSYTLVVTATDPAGNATSRTLHFTLDFTAPDVTVTGATEGLVTSQTVHPGASSTDASAVLSGELDGAAFTLGSAVATEGAHTFVAFATDPAGNVAVASVHFTIDRTAPDLTVTGVAEGGLYDHTVAALASSTDASAVIAAVLNGSPYTPGTDITAEGSYTLVVVALDPAGNVTTKTVHFTIDLTAPDVTISGVFEGELTSATVHPDASSTDASAVVTGELDGAVLPLGSAVATEGTHTFVAYATDPAGNVASATVHFTIDRTAPDLTVYGVVDDGSYSTTIRVTADSADASAVITALLDGAPYPLGTDIGSGVHTLVVTAVDPAGNTTTRTIHFTIDTTSPDTTPPDLTVTGVFDGELTSQTVVPDAASTDPTAILSATLNGDDFALGSSVATDGVYVLVAVARDGAGNAATATVRFTVDKTPPPLAVSGVGEGDVTSATVHPDASSTDASAVVTAVLDGAPFTLGSAVATEGAHTLVATAIDPAGNVSTRTVHFTIDRTAPDVTILGVANGTTYDTSRTPTASSTDPSATLSATLDGQPFVLGTPVTVDGTYTLVVTATDPAGNRASSTVVFTIALPTPPVTPPAAPANLIATAGFASITADWNDNAEPDLSSYELYRALGPDGPFSLVTTTAAGTSMHEDAGVDIGVHYFYRVVAVSSTGATSTPSNVASATIYPNVRRLWGDDRYGTTADAVSRNFTSAGTVIIATGERFPDALAGAGLAGSYHAPILLTHRTVMPTEIKSEITRLGAGHAIILGNTRAVDDAVKRDLQGMGLTVDRIGGVDRYETAVLIGRAIEAREGTRAVAFLARGDLFPDALAVSPLAYALKAPVVLTVPTRLPSFSQGYFAEKKFADVVVAGDRFAVSNPVYDQVDALTGTLVRQGGSTRYYTAELVARYGVSQGWAKWQRIAIAVGTNWPDALTGGPVVGERNGVLLLTPTGYLHPATESALTDNRNKIAEVDVLGSTNAIAQSVMARIAALLPKP